MLTLNLLWLPGWAVAFWKVVHFQDILHQFQVFSICTSYLWELQVSFCFCKYEFIMNKTTQTKIFNAKRFPVVRNSKLTSCCLWPYPCWMNMPQLCCETSSNNLKLIYKHTYLQYKACMSEKSWTIKKRWRQKSSSTAWHRQTGAARQALLPVVRRLIIPCEAHIVRREVNSHSGIMSLASRWSLAWSWLTQSKTATLLLHRWLKEMIGACDDVLNGPLGYPLPGIAASSAFCGHSEPIIKKTFKTRLTEFSLT